MYVLVEPIPGLKKEISNLRYFFMSKDKRKYYKKQGTITYADYSRIKSGETPQRKRPSEEQRRQAYKEAKAHKARYPTGYPGSEEREQTQQRIPLLNPFDTWMSSYDTSASMGNNEDDKKHAHHKPSDDSSHNSHHTHHDYGHSSDSTHHNSGSSSYDSGGDSGGSDGGGGGGGD